MSQLQLQSLNLRRGGAMALVLVFLVSVCATIAVTVVLITMFQHKQAARTMFVRIADVSEISTDAAPWGLNWPLQYDGWKATAGDKFYGGSSAMPQSKLDLQPWLKRLYAGYAFSIDYRKARGHAYMLYDQSVTERITKRPQSGGCLHCHGSVNVLYRKAGLEAMGLSADEESLAGDFNEAAVIRGFEVVSTMPYFEALEQLGAVPDGTPDDSEPYFPMPPEGGFTGEIAGEPIPEGHPGIGNVHPVTCIDCHDPYSMSIRVTRPGFIQGIAALAASDDPTPHLPSIERWRRGDRSTPYNPNQDASRHEMRSFTCGQCHVEYYCADKMTLLFPWGNGLKMEDIERFWDELRFPDGSPFVDYMHGETGAPIYKVQHPEFELWSQGIHARSGVSCADCHMPYQRVGAMKVSNHNVQSPLENINSACQQCHNVNEQDLLDRVYTIQNRTVEMIERAAVAMTDMLDAILETKASGATDKQLAPALTLQRKAMWRLDYISSENSQGFHADQEAMRILAESIDYSRQATILAIGLRTGAAPSIERITTEPVRGISENEE